MSKGSNGRRGDSSTRWQMIAALPPEIHGENLLMSSPSEKSIQLYSQTLGNQNAIKYVEEPLDKQGQQRCGNSSLQNRYVIIQIEAA